MNIAELATNLRLAYVKNNYAEMAGKPKLSHEEFLLRLLEGEWENRVENGSKRRIKEAKFPYKKYLCDFKRNKYGDEFIPEFDEIETLDFIEKNENIILIGTSGAGKTHYAIALGISACMAGKSVLFCSVANLITELKEALSKNQITNFRRKFERYALVILDELGYTSFDKAGAEMLFNLISSRNDKGSIIVTTNLTFDRWAEVFHDPTLTAATVDRLTLRGHILDISREQGGRFEETVTWIENRKKLRKSKS
jgi:DNA replication protein DnaC